MTCQFHQYPAIEGPSFLTPIAKKCTGDHEHISLSGWGNGPKRPTKGTAEYPRLLVKEWVQAAGSHVVRANGLFP